MRFKNPTPFPAFAFECVDQHDETFRVVVVRISFRWVLDEASQEQHLVWAREQMPLLLHDEWQGAPTSSSVRFESDLAPCKPRCDLVLHGEAHAPMGRPMERWTVGVRVSRPRSLRPPLSPWPPGAPMDTLRDKRLVVTGPRRWEHTPSEGWRLGKPEPCVTAPLSYENAYGGEHRPDPTDDEHLVCTTNPIGCGFFPKDAPVGLRRRLEEAGSFAAPRIERPDDPITDVHRAHALEGFGFVSKHWQPRLALAGTYDDAWRQERSPKLPGDFQLEFWNGAHPDLQVPYLVGGETIALLNLAPFDVAGSRRDDDGQTVVVRVPETNIRLRAVTDDDEHVRIGLNLDTLVIDTGKLLAWGTFRAVFPTAAVTAASLEVDLPHALLHERRSRGTPKTSSPPGGPHS
jgi:hypothetical protein